MHFCRGLASHATVIDQDQMVYTAGMEEPKANDNVRQRYLRCRFGRMWGGSMAVKRTLSPTHEAPYRGLRVLDFGQGIASPYCAMLFGVYGADVIKVEPPEGDWSRFLGTTYGSHTTLSAADPAAAVRSGHLCAGTDV